jgi:transketolase
VEAARLLLERGIASTVALVSTLRPEPGEDLRSLLARFPLAATVEAHYIHGGLGSLVGELIAENGLACRLLRCGVASMPTGASGSEAYMNQRHGLSSREIARRVLDALSP